MTNLLNLVVAHTLEAKFPVQWLGLQRCNDSPAIYSADNGIMLVVSGEGCACSKAAVEYLAEMQSPDAQPAWLNFGIAGHQHLALGSVMIPSKIVSQSSREAVYPSLVSGNENAGTLITVDRPEQLYPEDAAYDMEGFAFWQAASKHAALDLVQCLKLISDNREHAIAALNKARIEEILRSGKDALLARVDALIEIARQQPVQNPWPELVADLQMGLHFSTTQKIQLQRFVQRCHALEQKSLLIAIVEQGHQDARSLLGALKLGLSGKR